jgi:hypothetical protein
MVLQLSGKFLLRLARNKKLPGILSGRAYGWLCAEELLTLGLSLWYKGAIENLDGGNVYVLHVPMG